MNKLIERLATLIEGDGYLFQNKIEKIKWT